MSVHLCLSSVHVGDFSEEEVHSFLVESIQMKEFSHPHVMSLLGVSLDSGPSPYLVLPFMAGGSLLVHLKKNRSELVLKHDSETDVRRTTKLMIVMIEKCKLSSLVNESMCL